ncbi:MAG: hypothetical protein K6B13_10495 [Prevotella sp.]|nr:hypothetical protein [Prevotella sp.]
MDRLEVRGNGVQMKLSVYVYLDTEYPNGAMYVAYCPELDLVGYDDTEEGARKSFEIVVNDYLDYTLEHGTLEADLLAHGWRKRKNGKIVEPTYPSMMKHTSLMSVLANDSFSKFSLPVTV